MSGYVLASFFSYAVINAITPGPGNILALNTVTNYGYRKGRPLFVGIFAGYFIVQFFCAVFIYGVSSMLPSILSIMKYIGAAYIFWLAFHIVTSKPSDDSSESSASFTKGFLLQFVNVKIYLFGMTALTGYVTDYSTEFLVLLTFTMTIAVIGCIATSTWIIVGLGMQQVYQKYFKWINIVMVLILVENAISMLR